MEASQIRNAALRPAAQAPSWQLTLRLTPTRLIGLGLLLVILSAGTGALAYRYLADPQGPPPPNANRAMVASGGIDFVQAAESSSPSVVFIKTVSSAPRQSNFWDFWDFWGHSSGPTQSAGSGVILSADGYIVTNYHVVNKADRIEVILQSKQSFSAEVVGQDPNTDLAVLKIKPTADAPLKPITLGNSDALRIGEWVLAVGNPLNLTHTVTAGIVSAKGRNINILNSQFPIESFIQTDAAINPGNSGGALVNVAGELVGINTAIKSETGAYSGYGFAIPVNIVRKVFDDLVKYGELQQVFFGAEVRDVDATIAAKLSDRAYEGVYLYQLSKDGAAERAGLETGDVILRLDGRAINSTAEFMELLSYHRPGDKLKVEYKRSGKAKTTTLTLLNRNATTELLKSEIYSSEKLGADVAPLSKVEQQKLNVTAGWRLSNIRGGIIRQMGLQEGFVILAINKVQPTTPEELEGILLSSRGRLTIEGVNPNGGRGVFQFYTY
jgi:Do/DeqQ family serine protease